MKTDKSELTQISVPTKKISLEIDDSQTIEIVLRPFKQRHFANAIAIINKYFEQFNSVREGYITKRKEILDKYEDETTRSEALQELDSGFDQGIEIAKAILATGGEDINEDIKTIIQMSVYKATQVVTLEENKSTERIPFEPEFDDLTWGECFVLLGSTIGLNMDFFAQNSEAMNLMLVVKDEAKPNEKPKTGEELSAA